MVTTPSPVSRLLAEIVARNRAALQEAREQMVCGWTAAEVEAVYRDAEQVVQDLWADLHEVLDRAPERLAS